MSKLKAPKKVIPIGELPINAVEPNTWLADFTGKTVVLCKSFYRSGYFDGKPSNDVDRRFKVGGGFGASPGKIGRAVFGTFLEDGEHARIDRGDILGIALTQS